ncbi:unnamed protein product [Caenorhabditis bovis]|uniref:Uncharacterized protein n=1 Tax=Caenorhabditis bovis TaxID=2654633 RepID=A0A8S1EZQ9_9PELO|nr:unnamed protein product [Caenorhabditis bovis]
MTRKSTRIAYISFCYTFSSCIFLPFLLQKPNMDKAKQVLLNIESCPPKLFYNSDLYVLTDNFTTFMIVLTTFSLFILSQCAFYSLCTFYYLQFKISASPISTITQNFQKRVVRSLVIMISLNVTVIAIPFFALMLAMLVGFYDQGLNNVAILLMSTHGIYSTIFMIISTQGYREHILQFSEKKQRQVQNARLILTSSIRIMNAQSSCNRTDAFLESWHFMAFSCHFFSMFSIPIELYTIFLIVTKTPCRMRNVLAPLLQLQLWNFMADIGLGFLITPYLMFPCPCGVPLGLFRVLGVPTVYQVFYGQINIANLITAIILIFENRYSCIVETRFKMTRRSTRIAYTAFCYFISTCIFVPLVFRTPDVEATKRYLLEIDSCPPSLFYDSELYVFTDDYNMVSFLVLSFLTIVLIQCLFYVISTIYYLKFEFPISQASINTQRLQKRVFRGLLITTTLSVGVIMAPFILMSSTIFIEVYNQSMNNVAVFFVATHGMYSSMFIIFSNQSYREHTFKLLGRYTTSENPTPLVTATTRAYTCQVEPCPPRLLNDDSLFVLTHNENLLFKIIVACILFIASQNAFYFFATSYYLMASLPLIRISPKTQKLQKRVFAGLVISLALRVFFVIIPIVLLCTPIIVGFHSQSINNLSALLITNHGIYSTIFNIIAYKPYREYTKQLLRRNLITDACYGILAVPYMMLPCPCAINLGLLSQIGVPDNAQFYLGEISVLNLCIAVVLVFENRYSHLVETRFKITRRSTRIAYTALCYAWSCLAFTPFLFLEVSEEKAKLYLLDVDPCPLPLFYSEKLFVFSDDFELLSILAIISMLFIAIQIFYYFIATSYYLIIKIPKFQTSQKTRALQWNLFKSLMITISVCISAVLIPVTMCAVAMMLRIYSQSLNNTAILMLTTHGIFSTTFLIFSNTHYREYTGRLIGLIGRGPPADMSGKDTVYDAVLKALVSDAPKDDEFYWRLGKTVADLVKEERREAPAECDHRLSTAMIERVEWAVAKDEDQAVANKDRRERTCTFCHSRTHGTWRCNVVVFQCQRQKAADRIGVCLRCGRYHHTVTECGDRPVTCRICGGPHVHFWHAHPAAERLAHCNG